MALYVVSLGSVIALCMRNCVLAFCYIIYVSSNSNTISRVGQHSMLVLKARIAIIKLLYLFESNQSSISGINCWNPSFDVTPAALITGIITEKGVFAPDKLSEIESK